MKNKYLLPMMIAVLICCSIKTVHAAEGTIRLDVPKEMKEVTVIYSKDGLEEQQATFRQGEEVIIRNLSGGTYDIRIQDTETFEFTESEVPIPMWDEEMECMKYDVEIVPKYNRLETAPSTGDSEKGAKYIILGGISLLIVVLVSCHNHLKCGKMSHKYSKKRRT